MNCHQLYVHDLLKNSIQVVDRLATVPDTPGLGYELDRETVKRFRFEKPKERPNPDRLIEVSWPDGTKLYVAPAEVNSLIHLANRELIPYYKRGVTMKLLPDHGSAPWRRLYKEAKEVPVWAKR